MNGIDASFSRISKDQFQQFYDAGYRLFIQCLWTGGYQNNDTLRDVAAPNFRDARDAGLRIAGYVNAAPWRTPGLWLLEAAANAREMWGHLSHVAVDFEIEGTPESGVKDLAELLEIEGKKVCIYTARWFWERTQKPAWASLAKYPLWVAQYDNNPEGGNLFGPFEKLVGKQYKGSTQMFGAEVDLNTFDPEWWGLDKPETQEADLTQAQIDKTQSEQIEALQRRLDALEAAMGDFKFQIGDELAALRANTQALAQNVLVRGAVVKLDGDVRVL